VSDSTKFLITCGSRGIDKCEAHAYQITARQQAAKIADLEAALLNIKQQGYMKKLITHNDRLLSYTSHLEGQIEYLESKLKDQG
jgi:hypothetical protein